MGSLYLYLTAQKPLFVQLESELKKINRRRSRASRAQCPAAGDAANATPQLMRGCASEEVSDKLVGELDEASDLCAISSRDADGDRYTPINRVMA